MLARDAQGVIAVPAGFSSHRSLLDSCRRPSGAMRPEFRLGRRGDTGELYLPQGRQEKVGWLLGWLVGWLVGWVDGWLVAWLVWLFGWIDEWLVGLVVWLIGWMDGWLVG